ncbi:hypothetical protein [Albidovulum sp.]|uniref:hypothetical protein n=1 Tax=Albidovulum sp. TaxID=1872424 RepID=UPI0039B958A9
MVDRSGAARRPGKADHARPDALAYWYLQEITPLDAGDPAGAPPEPAPPEPVPEERRMASGWWLLPAALLSVPAWVALARFLMAGP